MMMLQNTQKLSVYVVVKFFSRLQPSFSTLKRGPAPVTKFRRKVSLLYMLVVSKTAVGRTLNLFTNLTQMIVDSNFVTSGELDITSINCKTHSPEVAFGAVEHV